MFFLWQSYRNILGNMFICLLAENQMRSSISLFCLYANMKLQSAAVSLAGNVESAPLTLTKSNKIYLPAPVCFV